jgi:hypothetical protein
MAGAVRSRAVKLIASERGRFLLSVSPMLAVLVLTEWLLANGQASFIGPLAWSGVVAGALLAGLLPALLLISSRRKGEFVPRVRLGMLGHPALVAAVALLFLANVFVHGLVIWTDPVERASAVAVGVLTVVAVLVMIRRGALSRRVAIRLWQDLRDNGHAVLTVVAGSWQPRTTVKLRRRDGGERTERTPVEIDDLPRLETAVIEIPPVAAPQLKVSALRTNISGDSEPLPALLVLRAESAHDLALAGGQLTLPFPGAGGPVELRLPEERD